MPKDSSVKLSDYGNILLSTYIEIANTSNLSLLTLRGDPTEEELTEAWESIIRQNSAQSGDRQFDNYFDLIKDYNSLIAKHTIVVCSLNLLAVCLIDYNRLATMFHLLEELRELGYKIDAQPIESFAKGISHSQKKANHMITQCERKKKELERLFPAKEEGEKDAVGYEEIIGHLELAIGWSIVNPESLTLAKYNVFRKSIDDKRKAQERSNRTRGHSGV